MPRYEVTIEAVVRKTYQVFADDEFIAQVKAGEKFTLEPEDDEHYSQEVIDIDEVPLTEDDRPEE